ncbi:L-threonylcarbamoyladenylate synthase [Nitrincola iocasae]|jgi:L-threonylcarbamoyladenylate synthase|uniref:Threonylcarbamoyl-AMP synthase n=1 Tax=Nitrincola iocasae TaxID=2614693 RepID=A0A5J6L940_9GAMM|nr:Sua5/YciO/YrdC/YwlC family protein [Nitrincola iocasae]QEW05025.1 tRNA threonylcarbamoyladenosine biosynthesis protein RimN [Nitrincola iocasae]
MNAWQLQQTVRVMQSGGVIAYPTEAVWGLGCDPYDRSAVMRLLKLKRRPVHKGLILVAASQAQIAPLLGGLTAEQLGWLDQTWPGPNTWLLPDPTGLVPDWIKGQHSQVAIRVSAHPLVKSLCEAWGGPIVSTSANPSNAYPARSRLKVMAYFGCGLDKIIDGKLGGQKSPSTIRSIADSSVIRL